MGHDVFISHSQQDKTVAIAVCAGLESAGIRCWIAPRDVVPGADWAKSIVDAIMGSSAMVVVFSAHANSSNPVQREVERAVSHAVTVVPFRVEDVVPSGSMEYFLGTPHWLDAMTPPLEGHIKRLAATMRTFLEQRRTEESATSKVAEPPAPPPPTQSPTASAGPVAELTRPARRKRFRKRSLVIGAIVVTVFTAAVFAIISLNQRTPFDDPNAVAPAMAPAPGPP